MDKPNVPERLRHDSMHVKDFRYIRMSGISGAGDWDALPKDQPVWHIQFPDAALKFRCRNPKGAEVLIQETVNPDSTTALRIKNGGHAIILGNTFIYFELELDKPAGTTYPL